MSTGLFMIFHQNHLPPLSGNNPVIDVLQIASVFCSPLEVKSVDELGRGNINDTYLVKTTHKRFVLQRINQHVFSQPEQVISNVLAVTDHFISAISTTATTHAINRWHNTSLLRAHGNDYFFHDKNNHIWRCMHYIENSTSYDSISSPQQGHEVGWALGCFHRMSADLHPGTLHETIPGFHVIPTTLHNYDRIHQPELTINSPEARYCLRTIQAHRHQAHQLESCKQTAQLTMAVIHGDPKVANVLFDSRNDLAKSLIDLDTVGPGLIHYDIGDCLRSSCNVAGEEGDTDAFVEFDTDICRELLAGYFSEVDTLMRPDQRQLIYEAVKLITFELGLRYFSDYLIGNRYFKVQDVNDNLHRSVRQFRLMESIIKKEKSIRLLVNDFN